MTSTLLWYKIPDLFSKKPVGLLIGLGMLLIRNVKIPNKVLILLLKRRKKEGAKVTSLGDVACAVGTATTLLGGVNRLTISMTSDLVWN